MFQPKPALTRDQFLRDFGDTTARCPECNWKGKIKDATIEVASAVACPRCETLVEIMEPFRGDPSVAPPV